MPTKYDRLLETFQGNAYPAMIDDLGRHLGVSGNSIRRLAPGWVPIVEFHNRKAGRLRKSFDGWWAIPERDANAAVVGLSLRSQDDAKVMYPGSKHGLVYEVNPDHSRGEKGYSAGAQNWVRTMDAGLPCPVCGKPDGCLISAEDVADPKAAVCIRVSEGSAAPLRMGYLHIRKAEGHLKNASPLMPSDLPVLIVEGFSDTAAAMDLGFVAVGRPSNLAGLGELRDLVRGRAVIVLGENDAKANGEWPGKKGMIAAFQTVKQVCRDVRMVMPPQHIKDLRPWIVTYGLTQNEFLGFVEKHGEQNVDATVIPDDRPTTIARAFLDQCYRLTSRYLLRRWESTWYRYSGEKYVPLKDEVFIQPLYKWGENKTLQRENPKTGEYTFQPLRVDNTLVANLSQALIAETLIESRQMPCWINGADGPNPRDLVVFNNGILDVPAFLSGMPDPLLDSTPDLFTTTALPIAFDPTAQCPVWLAFLESSLGDEPSKIQLLQEWVGYCLTPDTSYQKMLYMRGPTCCGKSIILRVLQSLVGNEQTASPNFAALSGDFGLAPLVGKLVCLIGDARTPRHGDSSRGLETLLNITGNDSVQVNRKFKDHLESLNLTCRISIASNEMLDLPDHAAAMPRRLNFIEFNRSFRSQPDIKLPDRLLAETPGIAVWALEGLRRLRERGAFTEPASSLEALKEWQIVNSPTAAFVEDCCDDDDPDGEVFKRELFDAWVAWSSERRFLQITSSKFYERIRTTCPTLRSETYEKGGHKLSMFRGLKLKQWAARKYTSKP